MNQLANEGEGDDYNVKFGNDTDEKRGKSLKVQDFEQDYSNLIDNNENDEGENENEIFDYDEMSKSKQEERSSLRMIDQINSDHFTCTRFNF